MLAISCEMLRRWRPTCSVCRSDVSAAAIDELCCRCCVSLCRILFLFFIAWDILSGIFLICSCLLYLFQYFKIYFVIYLVYFWFHSSSSHFAPLVVVGINRACKRVFRLVFLFLQLIKQQKINITLSFVFYLLFAFYGIDNCKLDTDWTVCQKNWFRVQQSAKQWIKYYKR